MSLSDYLETKLVDHVCGGSAFTQPSARYVKLHLADAGEAGTTSPAVEATRKAVTFAAASGNSAAATGSPVAEWTAVSTTETYSHFSLWDHVSAGNCLGSGALSATASMLAGDTFQLTALTFSLD